METSVHDAIVSSMPQLHAFAIKLCRDADQANDLVQETLVRGCNSIASFQPGTNLVGWLTTILRNHFYSEYRRSKHRRIEAIDEFADTLAAPATQITAIEIDELRAAVIQLRQNERTAVMLILGFGYSYEEAAEI